MTTKITIPFKQQFRQGLVWNLFDSVGSQGIIIAYHFFFRSYIGIVVHGIMSCSLSLMYLSSIFANLGLDYSIAPFFEEYTNTKRKFRNFIYHQLAPQLLWLCSAAYLFYYFFNAFINSIPLLAVLRVGITSVDPGLQFIAPLCITFVIESMRKTLKHFLQLAFYTRLTALVEVLASALYVALIVLLYVNGTAITLRSSWQLLAMTSLLQLIALICGLIIFYNTLPQEERLVQLSKDAQSINDDALKFDSKIEYKNKDVEHISQAHIDTGTMVSNNSLLFRIIKTRLFTWVNQCMNQLFSGNFLVPLCGIKFGIEQSSLMKIITSISYWITLIAQKTLGISSNALLAHLKSRSRELQQIAFTYLSSIFNQGLYFLCAFLLLNGKKITLLQWKDQPIVTWSLLYAMILITFIESFFILYEKWYIFEEKIHYYLALNALSFGILFIMLPQLSTPQSILILVMIVRLITYLILTLMSFYLWRIWPQLKPSKTTIITTLVLSIAFYFLV